MFVIQQQLFTVLGLYIQTNIMFLPNRMWINPTGFTLPEIGKYYSRYGGYFVGIMTNGTNNNYTEAWLLFAASLVETGWANPTRIWGSTALSISNSLFDGYANQNAQVWTSEYQAMYEIQQFNTGALAADNLGFDDWFLPSMYEMTLAYMNMKPTTASTTATHTNQFALPGRFVGLNAAPVVVQTSHTIFQSGNDEAFVARSYWTSSSSSSSKYVYNMVNGAQGATPAYGNAYNIRPFRRALVDLTKHKDKLPDK